MKDKSCLNCGKPIKQTEGKKERLFCKDEVGKTSCRTAYWKKNIAPEKEKKKVVFIQDDSGAWKTADGRVGRFIWADEEGGENEKKNTSPVAPPSGWIPPHPKKEDFENSWEYGFAKSEWKQKYNI